MKLSSGTFLSNSFIRSTEFISLIYPHPQYKDEYYFSMAYFDNNGVLKSFELRFDDEEKAKRIREEIVEKRLGYETTIA